MSLPAAPPRTTSDAITTSSSNEAAMSIGYVKKHQLRAVTKKAMNAKVSEDAVRRAIELYDLEKSHTDQPEEVMDEVEQILGTAGIQWPSPEYRRMMIFGKLSQSLEKVLTSYGYGYKLFAYYGENKKPRCKISPNPEQEPPPLPEWLQIPISRPGEGLLVENHS